LLPDLGAHLHPADSTPWTIHFVLTLITLLPAILMCMTPLVRLLVVFHFLRQALGTQTAPSNPTLLGLSLMMTWFLMAPVLNQVDQQAVEPYRSWLAICPANRSISLSKARVRPYTSPSASSPSCVEQSKVTATPGNETTRGASKYATASTNTALVRIGSAFEEKGANATIPLTRTRVRTNALRKWLHCGSIECLLADVTMKVSEQGEGVSSKAA
jgi:hypothetical protein